MRWPSPRGPRPSSAPFVPNSLRPMSMDLGDLDLDLPVPAQVARRALRRGRRRPRRDRGRSRLHGAARPHRDGRRVRPGERRGGRGRGRASAGRGSRRRAASPGGPAHPRAWAPAAAPATNAAPSDGSPMNPQFTSRFNEDTTKKLLSADKSRETKSKSRHAGGGAAELVQVQVDDLHDRRQQVRSAQQLDLSAVPAARSGAAPDFRAVPAARSRRAPGFRSASGSATIGPMSAALARVSGMSPSVDPELELLAPDRRRRRSRVLDRRSGAERAAHHRRLHRLVPRGAAQGRRVRARSSSSTARPTARRRSRSPRGARVLKTPKRGLGPRLHRQPAVHPRQVRHPGRLRLHLRLSRARARSSRSSATAPSSSWARASAATSSPARCRRCTATSARPVTTWILNVIFSSHFSDIHCGMRGITQGGARAHGPALAVVGVRLRDGAQVGPHEAADRGGARSAS